MSTTFVFRGLDNAGKTVRGELFADDAPGAIAQLKARAIFPTVVTPKAAESRPTPSGAASPGLFNRRDMTADVTMFTRQLSNLVGGGVPLMTGFVALAAHTENPRLCAVLETMQQDVRGGKALWEALSLHPAIFPTLYVSMVKAGEASGQLSAVLDWLAEYQEKEQSRRMQVRAALAYPTLLAVAGAIAITLLITTVVPKFSALFVEFNQALPLPTVILLSTAGFIGHWGWTVLVGGALLAFTYSRYVRTSHGKLKVDAWRLRVPVFGKLAMRSAMSRFARTTATLLKGGVPLLDALAVVRDVLDNEVLAQATDQAREGMREGERFAERLQSTGAFPGFLTHMIGIGEETGDLRSMLLTVAGTYDIEVETALKSLVSLLEPVIIITIGGLMGFIILSMLLPIFQINLLGS